MKKLLGLFAVCSALFLGGVAHAQPGAPMPAGAPGAMPPGAPSTTTVGINQTTTSEYPAPSATAIDSPDSGTMPKTGGAPIAMALSGLLTAGGAFFARRKLA